MNALIEHPGVRVEQLPPLLQCASQGTIRLSGPVIEGRGRGLAWLLDRLLDMPEAGTAEPLVGSCGNLDLHDSAELVASAPLQKA
ncbi:hypothetical protein [Pseudomonas cavernicola]|uniref:hypothetical protein n=1 Tax=Pseudomonas cavernicola TaxID=2320866 RepID=UPI000E7648CE|nr:hypothetical protein [Pseudomonas cavernicola]